MKEIINKQWNYILYEDSDSLILSVVCGGAGLFTVDLKLDSSQHEEFLRKGEDFLDELSSQIRSEPSKFVDSKKKSDFKNDKSVLNRESINTNRKSFIKSLFKFFKFKV